MKAFADEVRFSFDPKAGLCVELTKVCGRAGSHSSNAKK
jgi:hypothetical protein